MKRTTQQSVQRTARVFLTMLSSILLGIVLANPSIGATPTPTSTPTGTPTSGTFAALDVDQNDEVSVASDLVYIARYLLGLPPVPASFRELDPSIVPNGVIAGRIGALLQPLPSDDTAHVLVTGQTTPYGTGSDGDLQKGVPRSYTDNGDGTITDNRTGLMWEKKDQSGGIHDWGNTYTWSGASWNGANVMDGTITSTFLATLNAGGGFAGHTDWRIPNQNELLTLVNYQNVNPAVDAAFNTSCVPGCTVSTCSCTQSTNYWSSTTYPYYPNFAWYVVFYAGHGNAESKGGNIWVRAVRGGL